MTITRHVLAPAALVGALALAGCGSAGSGPSPETDATATATDPAGSASDAGLPNGSALLAPLGLDQVPATEAIAQLDLLPAADRPTDLMASVRADQLLLMGAAGEEESVALPEGEFYVSFAPYVEQTHECYYHSLTTCVGELRNEEISLRIVDQTDGSVVLDDVVTTHDNGFYGVWLPSESDFTFSVEFDGRSVTQDVSTSEEDPTCITTMRLT